MSNYKSVGMIAGDPLCGLSERMCIRADLVTDGCESRRAGETSVLNLDNFQGGTKAPFTYISAYGQPASSFTVHKACPVGGGCCHVTGTLQIPLKVQYRDADGVCGCADGTIELTRTLSLRVPSGGLAQTRFEGEAAVVCTSGAFLSERTLTVSFCIAETFRSVVRADILVPTYGFAQYPPCADCDGCAELLESELFPQT